MAARHSTPFWPMVLACAALMAVTTGIRLSLGLFVRPIVATGISLAYMSLVLAIGQFFWGAVQPLFGMLATRIGALRVVACGGLLLGLGFGLAPVFRGATGLLVTLGVLSAAGAGAASFAILVGAVMQRLPAVRLGLDQLQSAMQHMKQHRRTGPLQISLLASFLQMWLLPRIRAFRRQCPDVALRFHASRELVDFSHAAIHVAVRFGRGNYPNLHVEKLLDEWLVPVAHPDLIKQFGLLDRDTDLAGVPLLGSDDEPRRAASRARHRSRLDRALAYPGPIQGHSGNQGLSEHAAASAKGDRSVLGVRAADRLFWGPVRSPPGAPDVRRCIEPDEPASREFAQCL